MRTIEEVLAERHQGDLISRKALKERKFTTQVCNGVEIESVDVVGVATIDNAPTVDTTCPNCDSGYAQGYSDGYLKGKEERPHGEWIPVSEKLPEGKIDPMTNDFELVLCSTVWEVVRPYKFGKPIGHSKAHFWSGGGIMDDYVIAWKPMPEPYKEEAENEIQR